MGSIFLYRKAKTFLLFSLLRKLFGKKTKRYLHDLKVDIHKRRKNMSIYKEPRELS